MLQASPGVPTIANYNPNIMMDDKPRGLRKAFQRLKKVYGKVKNYAPLAWKIAKAVGPLLMQSGPAEGEPMIDVCLEQNNLYNALATLKNSALKARYDLQQIQVDYDWL